MEITPGLGPASNGGGASISEAQLRVLHALSARGERLVAELAEALKVHPNGVRRHLSSLADAGLVVAAPAPVHGRGRPSTAYSLTDIGRTALARSASPDALGHVAMAGAVADYLTAVQDDPGPAARAIGRRWGARLAASGDGDGLSARSSHTQESRRAPESARMPSPSTERTMRLLTDMGFAPLAREDGVIALRACPLLEAAREHPEVVCQMHLGIVQGATQTDGGVIRPFSEPGACLLELPGGVPEAG